MYNELSLRALQPVSNRIEIANISIIPTLSGEVDENGEYYIRTREWNDCDLIRTRTGYIFFPTHYEDADIMSMLLKVKKMR